MASRKYTGNTGSGEGIGGQETQKPYSWRGAEILYRANL